MIKSYDRFSVKQHESKARERDDRGRFQHVYTSAIGMIAQKKEEKPV